MLGLRWRSGSGGAWEPDYNESRSGPADERGYKLEMQHLRLRVFCRAIARRQARTADRSIKKVGSWRLKNLAGAEARTNSQPRRARVQNSCPFRLTPSRTFAHSWAVSR